jgi:hypothetical protein
MPAVFSELHAELQAERFRSSITDGVTASFQMLHGQLAARSWPR